MSDELGPTAPKVTRFGQTIASRARGGRPANYGRPSPQPAPPAPGVTVEQVTDDHLEEFVRTVADAFEWPDAWREPAMDEARRRFRTDHAHFLVRWDGEPAGAGALRVREGVASLSGGAVAARLRGKGCHLALVHHRVQVAHALGCEMVIGGADFGTASLRNQQRAGLRLAYVESSWGRAWAEPGPSGATT